MNDIFNSEKYNLEGKYRYSWVEENFDLDSGDKLGVAHTNRYATANLNKKKIKYFLIFIFLCLGIIGARIFQLQIYSGNKYFGLAEGNRIRVRPIPSERGIIYDRKKIELVQNVPSFSLVVSPRDLPKGPTEKWEIYTIISKFTSTTPDEINDLIEKYKNFSYETLTIANDLDYDLALKIYTQYDSLPGVMVISNTKRLYKFGKTENKYPSISHLLGYVGKISPSDTNELQSGLYQPGDSIGKVGLEKQYENELKGTFGKKKIEVNARGKEQSILAEEPPVPGKNLILSIDLEAQNKLEEIMNAYLKSFKKTRASGIVLNPQNGEVLAMVSLPSFNNNDFSGGIKTETYKQYLNNPDKPLFNRTIKGAYPSGSTIKPVMVAAALAEKVITQNTSFMSNGGIKVNKWFFPDWKAGGHGITNARKAIAWSVNTFFYYIGGGGYQDFQGLGVEKIIKYLKEFGLGQKSNIDLPEENTGFIPSKEWKKTAKGEQWYVGDTYNLSIGQGDLLITPLQVANWTAGVANGGKIYQPHLVKQIENAKDNTIYDIEPKVEFTTTVSPADMEISRLGMRDCVIYGSCGGLRSLGFESAGKTGTAQWNNNKEPHAWFTSFAPFDNPQVVVTILVEEGKEGSTVAMPIASQFLSWWGANRLEK